jgi:hypothetical protein
MWLVDSGGDVGTLSLHVFGRRWAFWLSSIYETDTPFGGLIREEKNVLPLKEWRIPLMDMRKLHQTSNYV